MTNVQCLVFIWSMFAMRVVTAHTPTQPLTSSTTNSTTNSNSHRTPTDTNSANNGTLGENGTSANLSETMGASAAQTSLTDEANGTDLPSMSTTEMSTEPTPHATASTSISSPDGSGDPAAATPPPSSGSPSSLQSDSTNSSPTSIAIVTAVTQTTFSSVSISEVSDGRNVQGSSKHSHLGAILGGVFGGLFAVALCGIVICRHRQRRRSHTRSTGVRDNTETGSIRSILWMPEHFVTARRQAPKADDSRVMQEQSPLHVAVKGQSYRGSGDDAQVHYSSFEESFEDDEWHAQ
ncbi:hypothetical protein HGRIS_010204 [Hohenbuehelia grisea]|uniref:Mid2 domain-containing protein n=1 Tax=Hohenbuehelia grisea TaxID=104357 RepID=A0ABR3J502_9AGAR